MSRGTLGVPCRRNVLVTKLNMNIKEGYPLGINRLPSGWLKLIILTTKIDLNSKLHWPLTGVD